MNMVYCDPLSNFFPGSILPRSASSLPLIGCDINIFLQPSDPYQAMNTSQSEGLSADLCLVHMRFELMGCLSNGQSRQASDVSLA